MDQAATPRNLETLISRLISVWLVLALIATSALPASASDDEWKPLISDRNDLVVSVVSRSASTITNSSSIPFLSVDCRKPSSILPCERSASSRRLSATEFESQFAKDPSILRASFILPHCESSESDFCIEQLSVGEKDASLVFERYITKVVETSSAKTVLPSWGTTSIWKVEGSRDSDLRYMVNARVTALWDRESTIRYRDLIVDVIPFRPYQSDEYLDYASLAKKYPRWVLTANELIQVGDKACSRPFWIQDGVCYAKEDFPPRSQVSISMDVPKNLSGWLSARASDIEASRVSNGPLSDLLTIRGFSISVPRVEVKVNKDISSLRTRGRSSIGDGAVNELKAWREAIEVSTKNASTSRESVWSVTISDPFLLPRLNSSQKINKCFSENPGIDGVVATNALFFDSNLPKLKDGAFEYRLAGLHRDFKGEIEQGFYQMQMDSDVLRCIYDLTTVPSFASVAITNDGAAPRVVTSKLEESRMSEMYSLEVNGITFSVVDLKVSFFSESEIRCVKGGKEKVIQETSTAKAKCPKGWKKT